MIRDAQLAVELAGRMPARLPPQNGGMEATQLALAENKTPLRWQATLCPGPRGPATTRRCCWFRSKTALLTPHRQRAELASGASPCRKSFPCRKRRPASSRRTSCPAGVRCGCGSPPRGFAIRGVRLNGKDVPLPGEPLAGTVRQIGAVTLPDGFLGGTGVNVLEFDVAQLGAGQVLPAELRGTHGPVVVTAEVILVPRAQQAKAPQAK